MKRRTFLQLLGIGLPAAACTKLENLKGNDADEIIKENKVPKGELAEAKILHVSSAATYTGARFAEKLYVSKCKWVMEDPQKRECFYNASLSAYEHIEHIFEQDNPKISSYESRYVFKEYHETVGALIRVDPFSGRLIDE